MLKTVTSKLQLPNELVKEIKRYGYTFSLSTFWKLLATTILSIGGVCWYFKLSIFFFFLICIPSLLLLPKVILSVYHHLYEQTRFADVNNYLEQMMYSFQKNPNILFALEETSKVFQEGELKACIDASLTIIYQNDEANLYQCAFHQLEACYGCSRMYTLHKFLMNVEDYGGSYETTLLILLEDRRLWIERIYELQQEKKRTKTKIFISIIFATFICSFISYIVPEQFQIKYNVISQGITALYLLASILLAYFAQIKLSGTWFCERQLDEDNKIVKRYNLCVSPDLKRLRKHAFVKAAIFFSFSVISYVSHMNLLFTLFCFLCTLFMITSPTRKIKFAKKATLKQIQQDFPVWMMELALLLQANNVHVALSLSKQQVPVVLKRELKVLLKNLEDMPNSIEPFLLFLQFFDIPDITSSMRMLYAMDSMGTGDSQKQITTLINRNNHLLDKAERIQNEDQLAGFGFFVYVPMLFGTVKMLVDMLLLLISITTQTKIR